MRPRLSSPIAAAIVLWTLHAGANPSARLVYVRGPGADLCPNEEAVRKAVAGRLGYDPFFLSAPTTIFVEASRDGDHFAAVVKLIDDQGVERGTRHLQSQTRDCGDLIGTLALTISLVVDSRSLASSLASTPTPPDGSAASTTPPPTSPATAPVASSSQPAPPPPVAAPPRRRRSSTSIAIARWRPRRRHRRRTQSRLLAWRRPLHPRRRVRSRTVPAATRSPPSGRSSTSRDRPSVAEKATRPLPRSPATKGSFPAGSSPKNAKLSPCGASC